MNTDEEIVDLDWINGYTVKPKEWLNCKHQPKIEKIGRSAEKCTCFVCKITWKIDSSN